MPVRLAVLPHSDEADPAEVARRLAPVLRALSDVNRLAIVLALAHEARTVKDLTGAVGLSQTLVSHHLRALREAGLVTMTPRGRSNVYTMCCGALAEPVRLLASMAATDPTTAPSANPPTPTHRPDHAFDTSRAFEPPTEGERT